MNFEVVDVVERIEERTFRRVKIISIKYYPHDSEPGAKIIRKGIKSQDDYDLMVGRGFRIAMGKWVSDGE